MECEEVCTGTVLWRLWKGDVTLIFLSKICRAIFVMPVHSSLPMLHYPQIIVCSVDHHYV